MTETPTVKTTGPLRPPPRAHPIAASARTSRSSPTPLPTSSRASPPSSLRPLPEAATAHAARQTRPRSRAAFARGSRGSRVARPSRISPRSPRLYCPRTKTGAGQRPPWLPRTWSRSRGTPPCGPSSGSTSLFSPTTRTPRMQDHALAVESVAPELADLRIELCPGHMSEGCFWKIYFVLLHPKLTKEEAQLLSTPQILEAREQLSQYFPYQTNLESNEDTVALTFSSADGTVPVEVASVLKDQDASMRATSFGKPDYGILQPIHLDAASKDSVSGAGAVSSDHIRISVPVQVVPMLRDATELSQSGMEESILAFSKEDATEFSQSMIEESTADFTAEDAVANEQTLRLVDSAPPKEDQQKQPSSDLSEQSSVVIQKADNDDIEDDGDEWLEEDTGGLGSTHIQIADDDEDVSFSDLEEDDDAV